MKDILQDIIANKRIEVDRQKQAVRLQTLLALGGERLERTTYSMRASLAASSSGIISEFKRKSPSKGWLHPDAAIAEIVPVYKEAGASACSILTDSQFFGGSLGDLCLARKLVDIPLLRKDFIIDEYQLYQARVMGADAVLLIEAELEYLNPHIDMLGVNNRNLGTFHTDVANSFRLAEKMQEIVKEKDLAPLLVSESGISSTEAVSQLREAGFRGFLIGETFMKTGQPGDTLSAFIGGLPC